ncbi:hypothetical protein DRQ18_07075 [bacterium]|nr:MAG: hypothetical protein DRQ18_07075 [bacterium]
MLFMICLLKDILTPYQIGVIQKYARDYDLDPYFLAALMIVESGGDSMVVSDLGAIGAFQIMPETWECLECRGNIRSFKDNARCAAKYLRILFDRYENDLFTVLQVYGGFRRRTRRYWWYVNAILEWWDSLTTKEIMPVFNVMLPVSSVKRGEYFLLLVGLKNTLPYSKVKIFLTMEGGIQISRISSSSFSDLRWYVTRTYNGRNLKGIIVVVEIPHWTRDKSGIIAYLFRAASPGRARITVFARIGAVFVPFYSSTTNALGHFCVPVEIKITGR